jgi:hypothetical protein
VTTIREYILSPSGRDAFVALNAAHNLAAMANDALYGISHLD